MALIACPGCGKKISSRSDTCTYCHYPLNDADGEHQDSFLRQQSISRQQRVIGLQSLALMAFAGGAALTFWLGVETAWLVLAGKVLMALGMLAYLGVRIWQLIRKR